MTKEEKELLFRDICGRIPYGTKAKYDANGVSEDVVISLATVKILQAIPTDREFPITIKPYLRPMSSMTHAEREEWFNVKFEATMALLRNCEEGSNIPNASPDIVSLNWLYERHFDCNNLIEQGLALEASEGMYKLE